MMARRLPAGPLGCVVTVTSIRCLLLAPLDALQVFTSCGRRSCKLDIVISTLSHGYKREIHFVAVRLSSPRSTEPCFGQTMSHLHSNPFAFGQPSQLQQQQQQQHPQLQPHHRSSSFGELAHPPSRLSPPPGSNLTHLLSHSGIGSHDPVRKESVDSGNAKRKEESGPKRGYRACVSGSTFHALTAGPLSSSQGQMRPGRREQPERATVLKMPARAAIMCLPPLRAC